MTERPRYALRFQVLPGPNVQEEASELARFCARHGVDEVVLFVAAEEFFSGHVQPTEEDTWYEGVAIAAEVLRAARLEVSLNPWVTAGHADRGRVDTHGFAPMVSPEGVPARAQASFACPRWRTWLAGHYGRFAELDFRVLWLEDDFRFHNHGPLTWGGGFEPEMLDRFTELAGAEVSREELLAAVTAPGRPHPWRALLARTWGEAQLEVAALLRDTVATRSGGRSRLGLMSSGLGAASVEGRDWHRLFRTLGEGTAHRPHFAPYGDAPASSLARSVALLELQRLLRPADAEVAPEVENWPHTEWSKSDTQTWSEMVTATFSGADALLLNVLPFTARTPQAHARTGRMLSRSRPALRWAAERSGPDLLTHGVGLPWYGDAGQAVRTRGSGSMRDLEVDELAGAAFLLPLGIPVTARQSAVSVLFGDLAWAAPDDDVRRLLSGGLLLDGTAAAILTERGYGDQLGVQVVEVAERDQPSPGAAYALERLTAAGAEAAGVLPDTLASVNNQPRIARLSAVAGTQVWSRILDARQEHWGDGLTLARNDLGGSVAVLAAGDPRSLPRSDQAQAVVHAVLNRVAGGSAAWPLVTGGPHLIAQFAEAGSRFRLVVTNGSADPARPIVHLPAGMPGPDHVTLLTPLAEPRPAACVLSPGAVEAQTEVPHRGILVMEWN